MWLCKILGHAKPDDNEFLRFSKNYFAIDRINNHHRVIEYYCTRCENWIRLGTINTTELEKEHKEVCICAAIKDTEGYVWRGHRHSDCISSAISAGRHIPHERESEWQGFMTTGNRFVNRYEGYELQIAAGIPSVSGGYRGERLFSEDLY